MPTVIANGKMAETSECGKLKEKVNVPEISPREVLMLLNKLGITKVTASELKQFLLG